MPKFSEVARVTARELGSEAGLVPDYMLVWRAMLRMAEHTTPMNPVPTGDGRLGVLMPGNEFAVAQALWPGRDKEELIEVMRETGRKKMVVIRQRHTGPGRAQPTVYWIALAPPADYKPPMHPGDEPTAAERREAKVSAKEAGEDRPAEPVVVRHPKKPGPVSGTPAPRRAAGKTTVPGRALQRSTDDIEAFDALVLETIKDSPVALSIPEVHAMLREATGVEHYHSYEASIRKQYRAGLLYRRQETTAEHRMRLADLPTAGRGRPYMLWSTVNPPPIRTTMPDVQGVVRGYKYARSALVESALRKEAEASVALDNSGDGQTFALEGPPAPRVAEMSADVMAVARNAIHVQLDAAIEEAEATHTAWQRALENVERLKNAMQALKDL